MWIEDRIASQSCAPTEILWGSEEKLENPGSSELWLAVRLPDCKPCLCCFGLVVILTHPHLKSGINRD